MGCNQSAGANEPVPGVLQVLEHEVPGVHEPQYYNKPSSYDHTIASPSNYSGDLGFDLTPEGYTDFREELSQLIELHNAVPNITLEEPSIIAVEAENEEILTPEEQEFRHQKVVEKLKGVYLTRAMMMHQANDETITAHEDVRLQLCEFFSKC